MKLPKEIYYKDELNDEFAFDNINPKKIDESWVYIHNSTWKKFTRIFWYRIIAIPLYFLYLKTVYAHKIVNRKVIKPYLKDSFFIFGNHTHNMCDAAIPTFVAFPKSVRVIVHANNVSIPVLGKINPSLGAIPLPGDRESTKNFLSCIETRVAQKEVIAIYPEAHIWPYYTKIRPFTSLSFRYPVQYEKPVFCFTNVYQKRKFTKKPKITTFVDGPFFADKNLSAKEQREDLRNKVYNAMIERAKLNNVELIKYIKVDESQKSENTNSN